MNSSVRAFCRKVSFGLCVLVVIVILFALAPPITAWGWRQIPFCIILLWLSIDAVVAYYYLRKIRVAMSRSFTQEFFVEGSSLEYLKSLAIKIERFVRELERRTAPF